MNIPSLPTDNLYKLVTMAGATLFLISFGFLFFSVNELNLQVAKTEGVVKVAEMEKERLHEMGIEITDKPKDEYSQQQILRFLEMRTDARRLLEMNKAARNNIKEMQSLIKISMFFGGLLFFISIFFWYFLLQRNQDVLIHSEAKLVKAKALLPVADE